MPGPRNDDDPHDPLSGYRPDMDQHPDDAPSPATALWFVLPGLMAFCVVMGVILSTYLF